MWALSSRFLFLSFRTNDAWKDPASKSCASGHWRVWRPRQLAASSFPRGRDLCAEAQGRGGTRSDPRRLASWICASAFGKVSVAFGRWYLSQQGLGQYRAGAVPALTGVYTT